MSKWTSEELTKIGSADELEIVPRRGDGTLRKPIPIWVVRVGDDLYVRSWRGTSGTWFRSTQVRHEGRIKAGGVEKEVTFAAEVNPELNDQIDTAYQTKYRRYAQYVPPTVTP
jgi:hypothetical protein